MNISHMIGIGLIPPFMILMLLKFIPESPRWLVQVDRIHEARDVLTKFNPDNEVDQIMEDIQSKAKEDSATWSDICCNLPEYMKPIMLVGLMIPLLSQATGTEAAVYYSPIILKQAGVANRDTEIIINIFVGLFKTILLIFPMMKVDVLGRKPLLIISLFGQSISALALAISLGTFKATVIPIIALFFYIGTFSLGLSTLAFVIPSEVFPLKYRAKCFGLAWLLNRMCSGLVGFSYPLLSEAITPTFVFIIYSIIASSGVVFVYFKVPETKGKPLEDIIDLFKLPNSNKSYEQQE